MITINGTYGNNGNLKLGKGVSLTNRQALRAPGRRNGAP